MAIVIITTLLPIIKFDQTYFHPDGENKDPFTLLDGILRFFMGYWGVIFLFVALSMMLPELF